MSRTPLAFILAVSAACGDNRGPESGPGDGGTADAGVPLDAAPPDPCPYPESLGGGGVEGECGFTPGAWYPLGDSDLTTWPERADQTSSSGSGLARAWQLALHGDGNATLLGGRDGKPRTRQRWEGSDWTLQGLPALVGPDSTPRITDTTPRIIDVAIDADGEPIVALESLVPFNSDDASDVFVLRHGPDGWQQLGDALRVPDWHEWVDGGTLTFDSDGGLLFGYMQGVEERGSAIVARWNGSDWARHGVGGSYGPGGGPLYLHAGGAGHAAVAYIDWSEEENRYVGQATHWDGARWNGVEHSFSGGARPFVDQDGVAYMIERVGETLQLFRLEGSSAVEVEPLDGVLDRLPAEARMRIWSAGPAGEEEVYLAVFRDGRWRDLSSSARGAGISNSVAASTEPFFAAGPGRVCVGWLEPVAARLRTLLRCHDWPDG